MGRQGEGFPGGAGYDPPSPTKAVRSKSGMESLRVRVVRWAGHATQPVATNTWHAEVAVPWQKCAGGVGSYSSREHLSTFHPECCQL